MSKLSHLDESGKARMVDVSGKVQQLRTARATGFIRLNGQTLALVRENSMKKGDVIAIAEFAGITAAKKTSDLIPLCHPLAITGIDVKAITMDDGVRIESEVRSVGPTGVEMEALTAVQVALLTVYDMCKATDKEMVISDVHLVEKTKEDIG